MPLPEAPEVFATISKDYICSWPVRIQYFKPSGKYYSDGEYTSYQKELHDIFREVRTLFEEGIQPGLVAGPMEFYAVIDVPGHPHNHPWLIIPMEGKQCSGH